MSCMSVAMPIPSSVTPGAVETESKCAELKFSLSTGGKKKKRWANLQQHATFTGKLGAGAFDLYENVGSLEAHTMRSDCP